MQWTILVADDLAPEGLDILGRAGRLEVKKGLKPAELSRELAGRHALVVRSATRVTAESLAGADRLLVIGRAGIGVDNVDVDAASRRGIVVMNTPDSGAVTTAEHAIAMLLALARKIPLADRWLHEGRWEKSALVGVELTGKTLGLVGLGRIGRVVAERAIGLRLRVLAFDPYVAADRVPAGVTLVPFERCLAEADFVSVHVPLMPETTHLIGREALRLMKPTARLVHCARGGIVDEQALGEALAEGRLAGAALDVFEREPIGRDHPLLGLPNVIVTPHVGASTEEARRAVAVDIARQVVTCLETGTVINGVNVPRIAPEEAERVTPFLDLGQRLAAFLVQAFPGPLERLTLHTQGEAPRRAVEAIQVAAAVGALRASGVTATPVNALALARERGVKVEATHGVVLKEYVDCVRVEVETGGQTHWASGTLLGRRGLRIVELDDTSLDALPQGEMLLTVHVDQPGVIGRIGTLLGAAGVNISRLQLGLRARGEAIGVLNLDGRPPESLLGEIGALPFIRRVSLVSLPIP